jgi:hypothetical protein
MRDVWREVVQPTAVPAFIAFTPALVVYAVLGPQSWSLLPTAMVSSLLFVALFWRGMRSGERTDLLANLPQPLRGVIPA